MQIEIIDIVRDEGYVVLLDSISKLWESARHNALQAINTELLEANWETGKYIVEYEQKGESRAQYGKQLLLNLSKDLSIRRGKGFSRSNLTYMRKLYLAFPKRETLSHILTWSHYFEILKCEDPLERQFYFNQAKSEKWNVRELKRQIKSSLFQRIALSTDKNGVLMLAKEGRQVMTASDIICDTYRFQEIQGRSCILPLYLEMLCPDKTSNVTKSGTMISVR